MDEQFECPNGCASPGMSTTLRSDASGLRCDSCFHSYEVSQLKGQRDWLQMPRLERVALFRGTAINVLREMYWLTDVQLQALKTEESEDALGAAPRTVSVAPSKAALRNLARGLDDIGALRELIDNALDALVRKRTAKAISVVVTLDRDLGRLVIEDDAGGMTFDELQRCLQLGSSGEPHARTIGRFGVGAKEAIYHFGEEITIRTRDRQSASGYFVRLPASWLQESSWDIEIVERSDLEAGTTRIEISKLDHLRVEPASTDLGLTYQRALRQGRLNLSIDGAQVTPPPEPTYLYPPEFYPRRYCFQAETVDVEVQVGIVRDAEESGIYLFAQDRFFKWWDWRNRDSEVLLRAKKARHQLVQHFRAEVDFTGNIADIPINANKDGVVYNRVLQKTASAFERIVMPYLQTITPLSQDGLMGRVVAMTREQKHVSAVVDSSPYDLGRWNDDRPIEKGQRPDLDAFKSAMQVAAAVSSQAREASEQHGSAQPNPNSVAYRDQAAGGVEVAPSGPAAERAEDENPSVEDMGDAKRLIGTCKILAPTDADAYEVARLLNRAAEQHDLTLEFSFAAAQVVQ